MDRTLAKKLMKELETEAKKIAAKYGVNVRVTGGSLDSTGFKPRMEFITKDSQGRTREENQWDTYAESLGLPKHILGKWYNGKKIMGLDMKKRKYPVVLETRTGERWKASATSVTNGWYSEIGE